MPFKKIFTDVLHPNFISDSFRFSFRLLESAENIVLGGFWKRNSEETLIINRIPSPLPQSIMRHSEDIVIDFRAIREIPSWKELQRNRKKNPARILKNSPPPPPCKSWFQIGHEKYWMFVISFCLALGTSDLLLRIGFAAVAPPIHAHPSWWGSRGHGGEERSLYRWLTDIPRTKTARKMSLISIMELKNGDESLGRGISNKEIGLTYHWNEFIWIDFVLTVLHRFRFSRISVGIRLEHFQVP